MVGGLTCERAAFCVQLGCHTDIGAQVQHHQHGDNHDDALPQQGGLKVPPKPGGTETHTIFSLKWMSWF